MRACVQENGPTKGSFLDRSCALVPRALTGEHNGQVVRMHTPTDAQSMQLKLNQVRKRVFFAPFKPNICQDRLGTNIGKTPK